MNLSKVTYSLYEDILYYLEIMNISMETFTTKLGLSKVTLQNIKKYQETTNKVIEKIYSYFYFNKLRLNQVKANYLCDGDDSILFHVPKVGCNISDSKEKGFNCNYGNGFYINNSYDTALSLVSTFDDSSIYSFRLKNLDDLNIVRFKTDLEWMLAICYCRGTIKRYENHPLLLSIKNKIQKADIIIAPIADNKMFSIMTAFANVDINQDVALHLLSASSLGLQYVIKTQKAMDKLECIERYYICNSEKEEAKKNTDNRSLEIETKLKLAKMKYKDGLFIEEIFNEGI